MIAWLSDRLERQRARRAFRRALAAPIPRGARLHVGSGDQRIEGWINLDRQWHPAVDRVCDVTRGIPADEAAAIFAEHFLEHLRLDAALDFLAECHRCLRPGGFLRLSTPNLDWVLRTQYGPEMLAERPGEAALRLNLAFYGWRHRFLWNLRALETALVAAGFTDLEERAYGESAHPELRGLERHERYADYGGLPHVLVVEARRGESQPERLAALRSLVRREFLDLQTDLYEVDGAPVAATFDEHARRATRAGSAGRSDGVP